MKIYLIQTPRELKHLAGFAADRKGCLGLASVWSAFTRQLGAGNTKLDGEIYAAFIRKGGALRGSIERIGKNGDTFLRVSTFSDAEKAFTFCDRELALVEDTDDVGH